MNDLIAFKEKLLKGFTIIVFEFVPLLDQISGISELLASEKIDEAEKEQIKQAFINLLPKIAHRSKLFRAELFKIREYLLINSQSINSLKIRQLQSNQLPPWDLLLLADPNRAKVEEYLHKSIIYLAWLDEEVVGVYVLLPLNKQEIELINIAIAENQQGKGLGKQLIMSAIQEAQMMNFQKIWVGTGNSSIAQLALYQKCGFQLSSIDKGFFIRNYPEPIFENGIQCVDMIRLEKNLSN